MNKNKERNNIKSLGRREVKLSAGHTKMIQEREGKGKIQESPMVAEKGRWAGGPGRQESVAKPGSQVTWGVQN